MSTTDQQILDRIIELEDQIASHGNATRDAMIEQGDLLNLIAPEGGKALEEIAAKCGISLSLARSRRTMATRLDPQTDLGREVRALLEEHDDVYVSFDALGSVLNDDDPIQLLSKLLFDAHAAGGDRITRDAVRRGRGKATGSVGTAEATGEKIAADPAYAAAMIEALGQAAKGMTQAERDALLSSVVSASLGVTESDRRRNQQGTRRAAAEHEANAGPKVLRPDLRTAGSLMELGGWMETITEEYDLDEEGAETARLIVQAVRYRCDLLEAWAGGNLAPLDQEDFDRQMAVLMEGGQS